MNKWFKVAVRLFAALLFIWGAMFLPFGVWASANQGSNPLLGWAIYLASVLTPWGIAVWLLRLSMKAEED
jgi:hypothetical protein